MPTIRSATAADRAAIEELLTASALPVAGLADHLASALVAESDGTLVGSAAVEGHGEHGLLRSVAVHPSWRASGLGARLVAAAIALAAERGLREIWLLTTTAERYFPRFGFEVVAREALPAALDASAELRGACPASAVAMRLRLPRC
jgi:amino-acid N-acetyltransferase